MNMVYDNKNMVYEKKLTKCELFVKKIVYISSVISSINAISDSVISLTQLQIKPTKEQPQYNEAGGGGVGRGGNYYNGRCRDVLPKRCTFFRVEVYKSVGI